MKEKYILLSVDGSFDIIDIEHDVLFDTVKSFIDCKYIETVSLVLLGNIYLLVDELGKCYDEPKPMNLLASMLYPGTAHGDVIVGDVVVCKSGWYYGEPDVVGLNEHDIQRLTELFGSMRSMADRDGALDGR